MPITVSEEAARFPLPLAMQAPHVQDTLCAEPTHVGHLHAAPWNAQTVVEQSPQPQPSG